MLASIVTQVMHTRVIQLCARETVTTHAVSESRLISCIDYELFHKQMVDVSRPLSQITRTLRLELVNKLPCCESARISNPLIESP